MCGVLRNDQVLKNDVAKQHANTNCASFPGGQCKFKTLSMTTFYHRSGIGRRGNYITIELG